MSNDISYVIKVVDDFSANLKKFDVSIATANKSATNFSNVAKFNTAKIKGFSLAASNAAYLGIPQYTRATDQAAESSKFFTQNLIDLGKATGIYFGVQSVKNFGKSLFDTQIQMQGLDASFAAIMPKFDKTKPAAQLAAEEIDYLRDATNRLGVSFEVALPSYMQFLAGSKENLATTRKSFEAFSGISRLYGLNTQQFQRVIYALGQMQNKGTVKLEELSGQLGDALPGALKLFADAVGKTEKEFLKFVGNGQVGAGIIKMVADFINQKFGKDMVAAANTLGGRTAVLGNQWLYFKTILSDQMAPVMSNTVADLISLTATVTSLLKAVGDPSAFYKLDSGMQAWVTTLRIAGGLLHGLGEEIKLIASIAGWIFKLPYKIGQFVALAGMNAETEDEKAIKRSAFQELFNTDEYKQSEQNSVKNASPIPVRMQQKINAQIDVVHQNAPRGLTSKVTSKTNPNLNVGNMVNYSPIPEGFY